MEAMNCGEVKGGTINQSYGQAAFPYNLQVTGMPLVHVAIKIDRKEEQHISQSVKFF